MNRQYQYILFDLDGTLSDPGTGITKGIQYALKHYGIDVQELDSLSKFIGPPLKDSFMHHYGFDEEKAVEAVEKYREYYKPIGMYENVQYEGIRELLQKLADSGKTVMLATSKPMVIAKGVLEFFDLDGFFTFIGGSELDNTRSKKSEVIQYVLDENNITDLGQVLMVGDREHDIHGAKEVGVDSVGVLYGYGDLDELKEAGATYIVKDISELAELLGL